MSETAVLTIDGPVSSGKGTVARLVAARLGWQTLKLWRPVGCVLGVADP